MIYFKEISRANLQTQNNDQSYPCSICLNDLVSCSGGGEEDEHSLLRDPVIKMCQCPHEFHKSCIEACFDTKKQCPLCLKWYDNCQGFQPLNSTMNVKQIPGCVPGHPTANGWFSITYVVPAGIQVNGHLRPGVPHAGTTRIAYLPNDEEGRQILKLLQKAFEYGHIFGVGDSLTTGNQNVPVWAIHHKTSMSGGPTCYGYPDPTFYARITQELHEVGITSQMLN